MNLKRHANTADKYLYLLQTIFQMLRWSFISLDSLLYTTYIYNGSAFDVVTIRMQLGNVNCSIRIVDHWGVWGYITIQPSRKLHKKVVLIYQVVLNFKACYEI